MICGACYGHGEVLIDAKGNIVHRLEDAVLIVPCPDCGGPCDVTNAPTDDA